MQETERRAERPGAAGKLWSVAHLSDVRGLYTAPRLSEGLGVDAPDSVLLERAVNGDAEALAALLERHGPGVRRSLGGAIARKWRALLSLDDVMQQAYSEAFGSIRRFTPHGDRSFADWLVVLARRVLIDAIRGLEADKRGGNRLRVGAAPGDDGSYDGLLEVLAATTTTPSRAAARVEGREALKGAIALLPETQRLVVERYDLQGQAAEEVAVAIGRSVGAVYMLRARAHRRLGEILGAASAYLSTGA